MYHALYKNLSYYPESEFQLLGDSKKSQQGGKKMTARMNFKIGCCETIFVHFSVLIYDVSRTIEMPSLQDWEGRLSFCYAYKCLHC